MAVTTRIDARSQHNNSIQVQTLDGVILCTIEAVGKSASSKEHHGVNLRFQVADNIQLVKSNGTVLRKK